MQAKQRCSLCVATEAESMRWTRKLGPLRLVVERTTCVVRASTTRDVLMIPDLFEPSSGFVMPEDPFDKGDGRKKTIYQRLVEEIHQFIQALQVEGRFDHAVRSRGRTKTRSVETTMNPCRGPTQLRYRNNVVKLTLCYMENFFLFKTLGLEPLQNLSKKARIGFIRAHHVTADHCIKRMPYTG